jgi:hypothetical protein
MAETAALPAHARRKDSELLKARLGAARQFPGQARHGAQPGGAHGRSTAATPLGGRRGRCDRPMRARRVGQGDRAEMAVRCGRVPLRMDQRALAGLGMRTQRGRGADAARRRCGRALWGA